MSKPASDATIIKRLRSELRRTNEILTKTASEARTQRIRAERAEAELADWKTRFDILLSRTEKVTK